MAWRQPYAGARGFQNIGGAKGWVYRGLIAGMINFYSTATAIAFTYQAEDRSFGTQPGIQFETRSLDINYKHPTPVEA